LKESSDGETLIAVGTVWFQICAAAEDRKHDFQYAWLLAS